MENILKTLGPTFLSLKEFGFAYGIQGILLKRNFERYWFLQCVTMAKYNVFFSPTNTLMANVRDLNDLELCKPPFGTAEIDNVKNTWNQSYFPPKSKSINHTIAKVTSIYECDFDIRHVDNLYYTIERQRRTWWRMISENPSIIYMSEVKRDKSKVYTEIEARLPTGNILVETINYKKSAKKILPNSEKLQVVEHVMSLDWGCLALLCDGFEMVDGKPELHMNPKLMPFKAYCRAAISPEDDEKTKNDLNDLSFYIVELLRQHGVHSVALNGVEQPEIFRVPYIISVDSETLKTGILRMICQRTLCGEQVHISQIAEKMYDICV